MIKDVLYVEDWKITVLYNCTCDDIDIIIKTLREINCPKHYLKEALDNLETCNLNTGLTYSNLKQRSSVIIINKTSSKAQLINSISHEYFHLLNHFQQFINIKDEEELATLNGNLNMHSYEIIENL